VSEEFLNNYNQDFNVKLNLRESEERKTTVFMNTCDEYYVPEF